MCVESRTPGLSFCHGHTFNPLYGVAIEIQKKEIMHLRGNIDFDCADPDSYNLAYQLQVHVCLDAL